MRALVQPSTRILALLVAVVAILVASGCADSAPPSTATVFEGARLIVGDGAVVEDGVLIVDNGEIAYAGSRAGAEIPDGAATIDLAGKSVMPAIVNAHAHLPVDRAERTDLLQHMAYYGTGLVISLGHDTGTVPLEMRSETLPDGARSQSAGRGITGLEPGRSEAPYWITTEEEARTAVQELATHQVDVVKIWVDDRNGQYEKLSPELYRSVINEAHEHGLRVTAHIFNLEDAKGLLRAGLDAFAHGIRDMDVDDELVALWAERPDVVLVPNLPGPGVAEDLGWLSQTVSADRLQEMQEGSVARPAAQEAFGIQARNLVRLRDEGVTIAFGTDGSAPWSVHQEMADMVRAGMTPAEVIVAATSTSAEFLDVSDVGTLAAGKSADFVVLDANPLDDIANTKRINAVYLRGAAVDRDGLSARFRAGTP